MFCRQLIALAAVLLLPLAMQAQQPAATLWQFAVSGDSRNCGDVVMPAIARSVLQHHAEFYWHLGDFRKMYDVDDDMLITYQGKLEKSEYLRIAWGDFLANQLASFGALPVFLGIGNHELYGDPDQNKRRADFLAQFAYWLDSPQIRAQRLSDDPAGNAPKAYYHWKKDGVDFINLDNASDYGFEEAQLKWLEKVLEKDQADTQVRTIVVGMHRALPNNYSCDHSMNGPDSGPDAEKGTASGRQAYRDLLNWKKESGKRVYVLASHSHFFLERIYDTDYWKNHEGVLPGWIIGTAGAVRYVLPSGVPADFLGKTYSSGYLLATVNPDGEIQFEFEELTKADLPKEVLDRYGRKFVDFCFLANRDTRQPQPPKSCSDK
jgi:hypothetical protein